MNAPPDIKRKQKPDWTRHELEFEVITPMMGGGSRTREADEVSVVRATSVLGNLRFWWRACKAADFADLDALAKREGEIWGKMSKPSAVRLRVECTNAGRAVDGFDFKSTVTPAYAAFPLQENRRERIPTGKVREGIVFRLALSYPSALHADVEAAIWAWVHFGGIGARTRRGFGCLYLSKTSMSDWKAENRDALHSKLSQDWPRYVSQNPPGESIKAVPKLPTKPSGLSLGRTSGDARMIWHRTIQEYGRFRQNRNAGNEPNRPGRSRWPEPDTIRRITGQHAAQHRPICSVEGFPRAYYGLPIVFHFKDAADPADVTLQGRKYDRRASPLLLKPVALASRKCVPLGILLVPYTLPPGGLILQRSGKEVPEFENWDKLAQLLNVPEIKSTGPFAPILKAISQI